MHMLQVSDLHCNCSFRNLFKASLNISVLEEELPLANLTADRFQVCTYTRAAVLHAPVHTVSSCSTIENVHARSTFRCTTTCGRSRGQSKTSRWGPTRTLTVTPNPNPNPTIHPNSNWLHLYTLHQIEPDPQRHLYFKSAFLMSHPMGSWRTAQRQMGGLTPVAEVVAGLVADDTMVGLHVRTVFDAPRDDATARTALGEEAVRAAESEYGTEGARRLMQWRKASHWSNFVPRIAALLQVQP